ncbi:MAG: MFS transporter [Myxococcota bacterium]
MNQASFSEAAPSEDVPGLGSVAVWAVVAVQFAPTFMFSGVAVILPHLGAELGAGSVALGLVETLFLGGSLSMLLPAGLLADAWDKRSLFKLGLSGFALTSLAVAMSSSMPVILGIRLLQGVCAATCAATGPGMLTELVPSHQRGRAFGASIASTYLGLAFGPVCAGLIVQSLGWRAVFTIGGLVLFVGLALVQLFLRSGLPPLLRRPPLDGVALSGGAVLSLVLGTAEVNTIFGPGLLGLGVLLVGLFVRRQLLSERPLLDLGSIIGNLALRDALLIQVMLYLHAFASVFMLSLYLQQVLGAPPRDAGFVLAGGTAFMAVMAPLSGGLADRFGPLRVAAVGVAFVLLSAGLGAVLRPAWGLWGPLAIMGGHGAGFGMFSSSNMTTIMGAVQPGQSGRAGSWAAMARSIGMLGGMLLTSLSISLALGKAGVEAAPEAFLGAMHGAYGTICVGLFVAALVSVRRILRPS